MRRDSPSWRLLVDESGGKNAHVRVEETRPISLESLGASMPSQKYEHRSITIMRMGEKYYEKPPKDQAQSTMTDFAQLGEQGWRVVYAREAGVNELFLLLEREKS